MNFCSHCGAPVTLRIPPGDQLPRHVCDRCHTIHYLNPKLIVGAIPEWGERILLCKRAIEPRYGKWTLPAGFMENEETTAEAARRETAEEACARIEVSEIYSLINVAYISQVHILYRARLLDLDFGPGPESLEVRLFEEHEIPWNELAFRSVAMTLRYYFEDRREGRFRFHVADIPAPSPAAAA
ncbi:MAG: NUDIX hydrolase [Betaproteobacteria bacterium]|nr:NUDIX hydrolase [Betaproteobacteria bacterium]